MHIGNRYAGILEKTTPALKIADQRKLYVAFVNICHATPATLPQIDLNAHIYSRTNRQHRSSSVSRGRHVGLRHAGQAQVVSI